MDVKFLPIVFSCILVVHTSNAQNSGINFFVFEDTLASLAFNQISRPDFDANFKPLPRNSLWHDPTKSAIWVRFKMTDRTQTERFLELTRPNLEEVTYYQPSVVGGIKKYETGMTKKFNTRPIPVDRFVFPITKGDEWHYIRIRSYHSINTDFNVMILQDVIEDASIRNLFFTLYVGFMLAVIAGVLFYVYLIRYYSYLFYIGYIAFINILSLMEKGFYFQILWPNNPGMNNYFPIVPFGLSICLLLFLRGIWTFNRTMRVLYNITLWGCITIPFVIAMTLFFRDQLEEMSVVTQSHTLFTSTFIISISFIAYANAEPILKLPLKLITTGLVILALSGFVFLATINHILPTNFLTENSIILGSVIEVGFLTAALIVRSDEIYKKQKLKLSQLESR